MMEKLKKLTESKKPMILFVLGLAGMLLILLSSLLPEGGKETKTADVSDPAAAIEQRLEALISQIDGAGETQVMVTLSDTGSTQYLRKDSKTEDWENGTLKSRETSGEYVTSGGGAVVVAQRTPAVSGVAVICKGGDRAGVQNDIYEVLYALYGLSSAHVSIEKMS